MSKNEFISKLDGAVQISVTAYNLRQLGKIRDIFDGHIVREKEIDYLDHLLERMMEVL